MSQMGKWLSLFLLFSSAALAQSPVVQPQPFLRMPYAPQLPVDTTDQSQNQQDYDPVILSESWGNCLQADVWVLIDYSGSMASFETFVAEALARIAGGIIQPGSNRRMGFISFNDNATLRLPLTNDVDQAYQAIKLFHKSPASGGTEIYEGLSSVTSNHLISPTNKSAKAPDYKKIMILISDGEDNNADTIIRTANKMKGEGWWIYSIMATKSHSSEPLETNPYFQLLKYISGNPNDPEEFYVDSILLSDLPEHFSQRFSCM